MAKASGNDLAARLQRLEKRLDRLERRRGAAFVEGLLRELVPADMRQHLRAAQREQLLAARSFLDHWIEKTERAEREPARGPRRRESIRVE